MLRKLSQPRGDPSIAAGTRSKPRSCKILPRLLALVVPEVRPSLATLNEKRAEAAGYSFTPGASQRSSNRGPFRRLCLNVALRAASTPTDSHETVCEELLLCGITRTERTALSRLFGEATGTCGRRALWGDLHPIPRITPCPQTAAFDTPK